jgi:DNA-binding CsgD family transcriptional regulator
MYKLSQAKWHKLMSSIETLNSGIETESLAKRLINSVNQLIPSDITAFDIFDEESLYKGYIVHEPFNAISKSELETFAELINEHPFFSELIDEKKSGILTLTDKSSESEFKKTNIYNHFYRRVGVSHQMSVALPVNTENFVTCTLNRSGQNFDEDEKALMNLFQPHLLSAIGNSWLFEHIRKCEDDLKTILKNGEHGIIALNTDGGLEFISKRAIRILGRHFSNEKLSRSYLPTSLWKWVKIAIEKSNDKKKYSAPIKPLRIKNSDEKLTVCFCFDSGSRFVTLLLRTKSRLTAKKLLELGVTKSEAKILYWVTMGKTNAEIAILCHISPRTVQKHIENICNKLGVENRTAAAMKAAEIIR